MTRRVILCEGPDDLNALRAIAQHLGWAKTVARGARQGGAGGQERSAILQAGDAVIEIVVPSKGREDPGEGKSVLPRMIAEKLRDLPPQVAPPDESNVGLVGVMFDPDEKAVPDFHRAVEEAVREHADQWALAGAGASGVWIAQRAANERVAVRAVDWRAPGGVVDGLPDHRNLERLLCAVLAQAYPQDSPHVVRWLTEIGAVRKTSTRKPATWKAAIHVWLALVYEKVDALNAATRLLHQQDACKPHVRPILDQVGLLGDLLPLIGPP